MKDIKINERTLKRIKELEANIQQLEVRRNIIYTTLVEASGHNPDDCKIEVNEDIIKIMKKDG